MGCFSYKCQNCGKGVLSSSFGGEKVKIFLLKDSKVIQQMEGEYNSYGSVFINKTQSKEVKHSLRESVKWKQITPFTDEEKEAAKSIGDEHKIWHQVCDLTFSDDISNGLAFIHSACFTGDIPVVRSADDPNQGWGDDDEDSLFGNVSIKIPGRKRKIVKDYCVLADHGIEFIKKEKWQIECTIRDLEHSLNWYTNGSSSSSKDILKMMVDSDTKRLNENKEKLKDINNILRDRAAASS